MEAETHRFKIGAIQCMAVSDGAFTYPAGMLFVNAPREEYEAALRDRHLPHDEILTPYVCLYLESGEHRILVDTGAGKFAPTTGRLMENLRNEGVDPGTIDTVILTHGHPDHIGGNLDSNGGLAFPNARYVMSRVEWDFWESKPDLADLNCDNYLRQLLAQCAAEKLPPIRNRLHLLDGEAEIVPGVRALQAYGHTPGHLALEISSQGEVLIDTVDAILHPILIERLDWYSVVDHHPKDAMASRRRLLERAADTGATVMAFHLPFPGLGRVRREKMGFSYTHGHGNS